MADPYLYGFYDEDGTFVPPRRAVAKKVVIVPKKAVAPIKSGPAPRQVQFYPGVFISCPAPLKTAKEGETKAKEFANRSKYSPAGATPNALYHERETTAKERQQPFYCGQRPEITEATITQMCEKDSGFYTNPYPYQRLGTPIECHRSGIKIRAPRAKRKT